MKTTANMNYGIGQYRLSCQYSCENGSRKLFQPHYEWPVARPHKSGCNCIRCNDPLSAVA